MINLVLCYQNHVEYTIFAVTTLGRQDIILDFTCLHKHNSKVDWTKREGTMSRCPQKCSICAAEDREECWA
ncbi:hypothetical protein J132_08235 [Termitomyces sp. J132]|nr:hypothetical protein J132_08235 [Termitomyces sp. J132]